MVVQMSQRRVLVKLQSQGTSSERRVPNRYYSPSSSSSSTQSDWGPSDNTETEVMSESMTLSVDFDQQELGQEEKSRSEYGRRSPSDHNSV